MKNQKSSLLLLTLLALSGSAQALADEAEELRSLRDTTIALVNALVQQGVLTREKADELIRKAEQAGKSGAVVAAAPPTPPAGAGAAAAGAAAGSAAVPPPGVIRVPYISETVKQQITDEVKQEVVEQAKEERWGSPGVLPTWLDRIAFRGDVRVRAQADRFPSGNPPNGTPEQFAQPQFGAYNIDNTTEPNNRLRLRVRFGFEAKVADTVTADVRLTSGPINDPSTENETLGNYNERGQVAFDLAFLTYRPVPWAYIMAGRLGNPFISPTTLVWGDDLSLQGIVGGLTPHFTRELQGFFTAGAFPIEQINPSPYTEAKTKWMWGYQAGYNWRISPQISWMLAGALYDYRHAEGIPDPTQFSTVYNLTAAPFRQKGNSVFDIAYLANAANGTQNYVIGLASKFNELNFSTALDLATLRGKNVVLSGDWVKNLGYDQQEIYNRTGQYVPEQTRGYQVRIAYGDLTFERKYAWQAFLGYRYVQSDAVVDAFTDADFHLGGTNATGYYFGARYAFATNSTIGIRYFTAKQIDSLPLSIDVLQIDWIAAF